MYKFPKNNNNFFTKHSVVRMNAGINKCKAWLRYWNDAEVFVGLVVACTMKSLCMHNIWLFFKV